MTEQEQIEKNLSEAFHLMYDGLPEPVSFATRRIALSRSIRRVRRSDACPARYARKGVPG